VEYSFAVNDYVRFRDSFGRELWSFGRIVARWLAEIHAYGEDLLVEHYRIVLNDGSTTVLNKLSFDIAPATLLDELVVAVMETENGYPRFS